MGPNWGLADHIIIPSNSVAPGYLRFHIYVFNPFFIEGFLLSEPYQEDSSSEASFSINPSFSNTTFPF